MAGTVSGQTAFDKLVRPAALCRGVTTENRKAEEAELDGVEEERDGKKLWETELAAPDWRVRAGPRNKATQKEREKIMNQHTYRSQTGAQRSAPPARQSVRGWPIAYPGKTRIVDQSRGEGTRSTTTTRKGGRIIST